MSLKRFCHYGEHRNQHRAEGRESQREAGFVRALILKGEASPYSRDALNITKTPTQKQRTKVQLQLRHFSHCYP